LHGHPISGEPFSGEAIVGEAIVGEAIVGEAIAGEMIVGEAFMDDASDDERLDPNEPGDGYFNLQSLGASAVLGEPLTDEPELLAGQPVEEPGDSAFDLPMFPASAIVQDDVVQDDLPPVQDDVEDAFSLPSGTVTPGADIPLLPAAAIVDEPPPQQDDIPPPQTDAPSAAIPVSRGKRRWSQTATFVTVVLAALTLMSGLAGAYFWLHRPPDPEAIWAEIMRDEFELQKWKRAEQRFQELKDQFPDHPRAQDVEFIVRLCEANREVYSTTGDMAEGWRLLNQVYLDFRNTDYFKRFPAELYTAFVRLQERTVEQATKTNNAERLELARQAQERLTTIGETMPDDWVPARTAKLAGELATAERQVAAANVKQRVLDALAANLDPQADGATMDDNYARSERLMAEQPDLRGDEDVRKAFVDAYAAESSRVRYEPFDAAAGIEPASANVNGGSGPDSVFVTWDNRPTPLDDSLIAADDVVLSLAAGVLYAFDRDGQLLWARRLGIDSYRLPVALPALPGMPSAVVAVSTVDNRLLALETTTGRVLWQYQAGSGQELAAPLTISRVRSGPNKPEVLRGLLPTANGEIHVLELARGRQIGRFVTGQPMTVGGVFDPLTKLIYFPADSRRVFAIDPLAIETEGPAAKSVLLTNHAAGTLRSQPVVVGPYLILAEADGLDSTRLRAYQLSAPNGFRSSSAAPVKERTIRGWSWFTPPTTPDRLTLVTDRGQLGVFGVNLDNPAEAFFPMIHDGNEAVPSLPVQDTFRSQAIYSDENLLWISAGGKLQLLALDILNQKVRPVWPAEGNDGPAPGIPLHEARMDDSLSRVYLTTKAIHGAAAHFTAVDAMTGERLWQRQLGVSPATDPILVNGQLLLVDRSGRSLYVRPGDVGEAPSVVVGPESSLAELGAGEWMTLTDDSGRAFLAVANEEEALLLLRPLVAESGTSDWSLVSLPAPLFGKPAIVGSDIVLPCADGRLHRRSWQSGTPPAGNQLPYQWATARQLAPDRGVRVYPLDQESVLLVDGRQLQRLQYVEAAGVWQWKPMGEPYYASSDIVGDPWVSDRAVMFADAGDRVVMLETKSLATKLAEWQLPGRVTAAPTLLSGQWITIVDERTVIAIAPESLASGEAAGDKPPWAWQAGPMPGRIVGRPYAGAGLILVTDESGRITALRSTDGQAIAEVELPPGDVPV
ncbi:MAG: PQQ-binding-like beta-propeller repeat protein, partial [Planctomycetales bacterium]|nr:PQQ-binding-like beta-propeller repeat protein [Planctomycetales bacterium]